MKILVLLLIIFFIFIFFRYFKNSNLNKKYKKDNEKVVDLEKDPKTNEYKPKE